jgi:hypothetical protein
MDNLKRVITAKQKRANTVCTQQVEVAAFSSGLRRSKLVLSKAALSPPVHPRIPHSLRSGAVTHTVEQKSNNEKRLLGD